MAGASDASSIRLDITGKLGSLWPKSVNWAFGSLRTPNPFNHLAPPTASFSRLTPIFTLLLSKPCQRTGGSIG
jgi:hypothetical protein